MGACPKLLVCVRAAKPLRLLVLGDPSADGVADDGFHPSEQSYSLWAEQLAAGIKIVELQ